MKYLIYLRVSTDKQNEDAQLDHCLRFIKQMDKSDFEYEIFRDKITSKKPFFSKDRDGNVIIKREGAKQLLSRLNKGDIIIAIRIDRIVRSLYETNNLIDVLEKFGAEILLVDQPGIKNKIMLGLYAGMAEEEIKLLRKRVSEKLESKKNVGERYSRFLPYGFGLHETKLVPIKVGDEIIMKRGVLVPIYEEQQVITRMSEYFDVGMSYNSIAKTLTSSGYKNREGRPFHKMSIYRILSRTGRTRSLDRLQGEKEAHLCRL